MTADDGNTKTMISQIENNYSTIQFQISDHLEDGGDDAVICEYESEGEDNEMEQDIEEEEEKEKKK